MEKSFVYDPKPNDMDQQELQKIQFEIDQKGSEFRKTLTSGPTDLAQAVYAINAREKKEDPIVAHAYVEFRRDKEDLVYLGLSIPKTRPKDTDYLNLKANSAAQFASGNTGTSGGAAARISSHAGINPASSSNTSATTSRSIPGASRPVATKPSRPASKNATPPQSRMPFAPVSCPKCGQGMVKRTVQKGPKTGQVVYGCSAYPSCLGWRPL